ncbi:hypothetical protein HYDPIDRAFT_39340 [Hydnomerulius pinastri MD-312]|nr:hypothetical protein HYDPIDRAFT_39340 [Hydnomerulius pinastri MD-312]
MLKYGSTSVTMVGHSMGGAVSLDSIYLPLWLPRGTTFKTIAYGLPRVGNQELANYVDANTNLTHINNMEDPVLVLPPMILSFVHPAGEVHIIDSWEWVACPGQDNPSTECSVGDVPIALLGNATEHPGPYNGIMLGCY